MHDPEVVARKVATFKKNFNSKTRKRFSNAAKKKWADPEFRAKRAKAWNKAIDIKKWEAGRKLGTPASLSKEGFRKRSRTQEIRLSNKINARKLGKEKVTVINNRGTKRRINDYCGVITQPELESLNG